MARWVPDDRSSLDRPASDIAAMYADLELRLVREARLLLTGPTTATAAALEESDRITAMADEILRLRDVARKSVDRLRDAVPEQLEQLSEKATRLGYLQAARELGATASRVPGARAAAAVTADLSSKLEDVHQRILRAPDDIYRRIVGVSMTTQLVGASYPRASQSEAWNRLLAEGVTGFTDRAGRRWNLATYVEMATRTAARKAWEDEHLATLEEAGAEFFTVIVGNDSCKRCCDWSGKILTLGGRVGRVESESILTGESLTVRVDGLVSDWRGQRHPNCTCRIVAWQPGTKPPQATTHNPEAEAARAKQRRLEVEIRKAKIEEAAAVTEPGQKAARAQVRKWQAQLRAHVDDTGRLRRREREQINLGHVRLDDGPSTAPKPWGHPPTLSPSVADAARTKFRPDELPESLDSIDFATTYELDNPPPPKRLDEVGERAGQHLKPGRLGEPKRHVTKAELEELGLVAEAATPYVRPRNHARRPEMSKNERKQEAQDTLTMKRLAALGIYLRKVEKRSTMRASTPDTVVLFGAATVELKAVDRASDSSTLINRLRQGKDQSPNLVLDLTDVNVSRSTIDATVKEAVRKFGLDVDTILILCRGGPPIRWTRGA